MPVLHLDKAHEHEHATFSKSFLPSSTFGPVPKPAPNLERTPGCTAVRPNPEIGEHSAEILSEFGFEPSEVQKLLQDDVVHQCDKKSKAKL